MTAWLLLNLAAGAAALAVGLARGAATRSLPLGLATLAGYLALVHALVLGAGLLGHLTTAGLGLPLIVLLAAALWLARRASWRAGAQTTGPVTATAVTYLIPLFGVTWGALFLGERLPVTALAAAFLILAGVALTTAGSRRRV